MDEVIEKKLEYGVDRFNYFAYGSNMLVKRLQHPERRCPSAEKIKPSEGSQHLIKKHRFRFHKRSNDGSGKGDAEETNNTNDVVYGVLFSIKDEEKWKLDKEEGFGRGYLEKTIDVIDEKTSDVTPAIIYFATDIVPNLKPYDWYKRQTVRGARDNGLPEEYVKKIEAFESKEDTIDVRRRREEKLLE